MPETDDAAGPMAACAEEHTAYRMLVAIDRDRLPAREDLPTRDVEARVPPPGALTTTYPAERPG